MPFQIVKTPKGYFVENIETKKRYSKNPLTELKAKQQFRILNKYLSTLEGSGLNKGQIKEIKAEPLTDLDIRAYFPNAKIISSSDIGDYNTIDELMPRDKESIFIIYESKPNYGHWCLISKYDPNVYEYFDSYGGNIDAPIKWVNSQKQKALDLKPYLTDLLEKTKNKDIIYSSKNFQKENANGDIATCGRHCVLRALTLQNDNQGLSDYIKMMNEIKKITGFSYDDIVSGIINI